jgi:hypothetical protein
MHALSKKYTRRAVKLGYDNSLCAIDHKCAFVCHIRYRSKINILNYGGEVLMIGVGTVKFEFCLQWNTVGVSTVETFLYSVARRVDEIIKEFKDKVVASVRDGEILAENFIESLVFSFLCGSI